MKKRSRGINRISIAASSFANNRYGIPDRDKAETACCHATRSGKGFAEMAAGFVSGGLVAARHDLPDRIAYLPSVDDDFHEVSFSKRLITSGKTLPCGFVLRQVQNSRIV